MINPSIHPLKLPRGNSLFGSFVVISLVFFLAFCVIGYFWISFGYQSVEKDTARHSTEYIEAQKQVLKSEVRRVRDYLQEEKQLAEEKLETELRNRVHKAHTMVESLYQQYQDELSDERIQQIIFTALKELRFNEGRGYYFILDYQGGLVMNPLVDHLSKQRDTVSLPPDFGEAHQRMMDMLMQQKEGITHYQWLGPNGDEHFVKRSYLTLFEPYQWIIGAGDYLEHYEKQMQEEVFKRVANISYGPNEEGYFFINSYDGDLYVTNGQYFGGAQNLWETRDDNGVPVVQQNSLLAQENPEGAFSSYVWKKKDGTLAEKISYVQGVDEWGVFIGTGAYIDSLDAVIASREEERLNELKGNIVKALTILGIALLVVFLVLYIITLKLKQNLGHFEANLVKSVDTWRPIDPKAIHFAEFKRVADSVNRMIDRLNGQAAELRHGAFYDHLTSLPNRRYGNEHLQTMINQAIKQDAMAALMFIDLDEFKEVNDTLGHSAGDELLKAVSGRLCTVLHANDTVARLGGDEFTVVTGLFHDELYPKIIAQKLLQQFEEPFEIQGQSMRITASIGVSLFPQDGESAEIVLRNADSAMYQAKRQGRNGYCFYNPKMTEAVSERFQLSDQLHEALTLEQFELYYQPQLRVDSLEVTGVEALIRWKHPQRGYVSPDQFIPFAEESGLINLIGIWVIRQACEQWVQWQAEGVPIRKIAVNISPRQIDVPFVSVVSYIFKETGCDPSAIEFEITESALVENPAGSKQVLDAIRALGVSLSIDDFGTGYSSLSYLKLLPISILKIDRSFISDIEKDENDKAITQAVIAMSQRLHLDVIAEGVETEEQLAFLRNEGCTMMQGYLFSKPLAEPELRQFLIDHQSVVIESEQRRVS